MNGFVVFLSVYFCFFIFLVYIFICGNTQKHRNGIIGKIYLFTTITIPSFCYQTFLLCLPKKMQRKAKNYEDTNFFNYVIVIFFVMIYIYFSSVYFINCYPKTNEFLENPNLHKKIAFILWILPWIFVLLVHFSNPGVINKYNVEEYLKIYPHDHVIYKEGICPTENIPIVPRSRYDRYSKRRIA